MGGARLSSLGVEVSNQNRMTTFVLSTVYARVIAQLYGLDNVAPMPYDSLHCNSDTNVYHPPVMRWVTVAVIVTVYRNFPHSSQANQVSRGLTSPNILPVHSNLCRKTFNYVSCAYNMTPPEYPKVSSSTIPLRVRTLWYGRLFRFWRQIAWA